MYINRIVVRNFRSFKHLDVSIGPGATCVIGENNVGKSNLLHAIRLCVDAGLSSTYRSLIPSDIHSGVDISHPEQVLVALEIADFAGKTKLGIHSHNSVQWLRSSESIPPQTSNL